MALRSIGAVLYDVLAKDKTAEGLDSASGRFKQMGTIAGAAMTGIGVGMTMMTDKARKLNAPLTATALQLGITTAEMRELALEMGNVTFPLEEVIGSFDLLTRAGMRNKDEIGATATAFDILGDAVGLSASQVTTIMIPAFNAFDLELRDASEYTDLFTHMQRNTTIELGHFSSMLNYIAPEIDNLGISLEQSVAVMEALADKGIQGSSATREFRTAITQADGDLNMFYEALGLTDGEIATYTERLSEAEGMTDKYADAMNTQYGFMDKLKYSVSELTLKYGSMLQPVEALGPSMAALGPIVITLSNINMGKIIPSLAALKVALLTNPIFLIAAVVAVVVVALIALEKKFGVLTLAAQVLSNAFGVVVEFFTGVFNTAIGAAQAVIGTFGDKLLLFLGPIGLVIYAFKNWDKIGPMIHEALSKVYDYITTPFMKVYDWLISLPSQFMEAGKGLVNAIVDGIVSLASAPYNAIKSALGPIGDLLPGSDAKEGPLSNLTASGKATLKTFNAGIESESAAPKNSFSEGIASMAPGGSGGSSGGVDGDTYAGDTLNIGPNYLSKDYDFPALMKDIENYQSSKRVQRGIRTL